MTKFLGVIILFALLYLVVIAISKYDATLSILLLDYRVDISLLLFIILLIIVICASTLGVRILTIILKTPYMIAAKLAGYKKNSHTKLVLDAYANIVMGKTLAAHNSIAKIDHQSSYSEFIDHINLLRVVSNQNSERNTALLHNLLSNKQYHDFAAKTLAKKLYDQGLYQQSLSFIEHASIDSSINKETMHLLILLYANLNMWDNCTNYITRFVGIFKEITKVEKDEISSIYLKCAKYYLAQGEEGNALGFLEKALEYNPIAIEAIELFCTINLSLGQKQRNVAILEMAFAAAPSFELFDLYHQSSTMDAEEVYDTLYNLADNRNYKDVFLAMAAYLKLYDKVDILLSCAI